jgi:hypothetical protein
MPADPHCVAHALRNGAAKRSMYNSWRPIAVRVEALALRIIPNPSTRTKNWSQNAAERDFCDKTERARQPPERRLPHLSNRMLSWLPASGSEEMLIGAQRKPSIG